MHLKLKGIRIIIYIDDILILSSSFAQCLIDAQIVVDLLVSLGFMIKAKKSVTTPSQSFFYLGYLWNTLDMTCSLPPEKLENIKFYCQEVLKSQFFPLSLLLTLNGIILSARPAVPLARAMARGLQEMILKTYTAEFKFNTKKTVSLTAWAKENVIWWLDLTQEECVMSLSTAPIWRSIRLATDSSDLEWGAVLSGQEMSDMWDEMDIKRIIAHKEWLSFDNCVRTNLAYLKGKLVTWHVDNQNARLAFINQGTARDLWLCRKVVELLLLLHEHQILVVPVYVRSLHHLHADFLSRRRILPDWHLQPVLATRIFAQYGQPEIDLMATNQSTQLVKYYSPLLDEEALAVDSLVQDWDKFRVNYVFPPPVMIELVLNRIFQCNHLTQFLLVTPWKPRSTWFPKTLLLSQEDPLRLPVSLQSVQDLAQSTCYPRTPSGKAMRFVVWRLSGGQGARVEDCPLGLSSLFSRAGRRVQRASMDWASDTSQTFVRNINWTHLLQIQ